MFLIFQKFVVKMKVKILIYVHIFYQKNHSIGVRMSYGESCPKKKYKKKINLMFWGLCCVLYFFYPHIYRGDMVKADYNNIISEIIIIIHKEKGCYK